MGVAPVGPCSARLRQKERGGGGGRLRKNGNQTQSTPNPPIYSQLATRYSRHLSFISSRSLPITNTYNSRRAQLNHIYHLFTSRYHRTGQDPRAPTRRNKGNTPRQSITKTSHSISHHGGQSKVGRRGHTVERPVLDRVERGQE